MIPSNQDFDLVTAPRLPLLKLETTPVLQQTHKLGGASGTVLNWFRSYLQDRNFFVSLGDFVSEPTQRDMWSPARRVPLRQIMPSNNIDHHCSADDTQIYVALPPNAHRPIDLLCQCIEQVAYFPLKKRLRALKSTQDLQKLVHAFITSKLDYCNGLLTGL